MLKCWLPWWYEVIVQLGVSMVLLVVLGKFISNPRPLSSSGRHPLIVCFPFHGIRLVKHKDTLSVSNSFQSKPQIHNDGYAFARSLQGVFIFCC